MSKKKKVFQATFETDLNASMSIRVRSVSKNNVIRIIKYHFPTAINIEI